MRFCTHCGSLVAENNFFCTECGAPFPGTKEPAAYEEYHYCNDCGNVLPDDKLPCSKCKAASPSRNKNQGDRLKSPKRTRLISFFVVFIFLAGGFVTMGYFYIKDQSSPERTIDSFIKSMKDGDARTLSDEVHNAVTGMYVNESEMKKLLNDLQKSPETMEAIIKSLKEQEKEFSNNKSSNTKRKSIIFALFKSPEKNGM